MVGITDVMTSKSSTLPYDVDTMQKMIKLVRKAKGTPKRYEDVGTTNFVAQSPMLVWNTTPLVLVSPGTGLILFIVLLMICVYPARLMSFFGKSRTSPTFVVL
jgi:hypothetical protein